MHHQAIQAHGPLCVAHGYGLKISVDRGHLLVHDGICDERQTRRYHRATSKLKRLIVIGHSGYITLDALRWLHDIGAALIHIDSDGKLITTSAATGPGHASLRRAQALAASHETGVAIARDLLHAKVAGQASLLPDLGATTEANTILTGALDVISAASDLMSLVAAEAEAASAYWGAWAEVGLDIKSRDRSRTPEHWHNFGKRHSPLGNGPRMACNPANAILNYLYALLEAETTLACHTVGLDPMLGIFHTDQRNRDSLALDAMEPIRPLVDAYVLALVTQRTLARSEFAETERGACRLAPQLAARLATTCNSWRDHVAPVVEGIANTLARAASRPTDISSPLTRAQHRAAWSTRAPSRTRQPQTATPVLANACRDCGTYLPDRRRCYCDDCRSSRWSKHAGQGRDTASDVLARLRSEKRDPAHGGHPAALRGAKNAVHQRAVRDWQGELPEPSVFATEIQPGLRRLPIADLIAVTGLSAHYCSLIRLGKKVPHPRHWSALRALSEAFATEMGG